MREYKKLFSLIIIALILIVSCTDPGAGFDGTAMLTLSVAQEENKTTSITGSSPAIGDITWTYTLIRTAGSEGAGQVASETRMEGTSVSRQVAFGPWRAEVWGYRDEACRELVYHGTGSGEVTNMGGRITVQAKTSVNASDAHSLNPADIAKNTADIVLCPIAVEGDTTGTIMKTADWYLDGNVIATWTATGGVWYDSSAGTAIPSGGQTVHVNPGAGRSLVLTVKDANGNIMGAEGWDNASLALNCTYLVEGTLVPRDCAVTISITVAALSGTPVLSKPKFVRLESLFDIDPTDEMPTSSAMIIGYRKATGNGPVNTTSLSQAISYPYVVVCEGTVPTKLTPSTLGLEAIYVTSAANLDTSGAKDVWFGKTATLYTSSVSDSNTNLRRARFVEGRTAIGMCFFWECTSLEEVFIPEGVTSIGNSAFAHCAMKTMILPESVNSIGMAAFDHCEALKDIYLPEGITEIPFSAFSSCTSLESITIPEGVTAIGEQSFSNCMGLTSITIPSTVQTISDRAFERCTALSQITLPVGVTSIGKSAFGVCNSLTELVIPSTVTSIGTNAFRYTGLKKLMIDRTSGSLDISNAAVPSSCTVLWKGQF